MPSWEIFIWGLLGGLGAEAIVIYDIFHQKPSVFPWWIKSKKYYIIASIMILFGGAIALAYSRSGATLNAILSLQIGASTPIILRKLIDASSERPSPPDPSRVD